MYCQIKVDPTNLTYNLIVNNEIVLSTTSLTFAEKHAYKLNGMLNSAQAVNNKIKAYLKIQQIGI